MTVAIERIQVEEGFMAGLDLHFAPGLNVIIGPRGVGKTSVIELIRYCLGIRATSEEFEDKAREHALSVLGSGQVSVTLREGKREVFVSRTANDDEPRASSAFRTPLIYSQSEIERVGLESTGRVRIIDGFAGVESQTRDEKRLEANIRSLTVEIRQLAHEIEVASGHVSAMASVPDELQAAIDAQNVILRNVEQSGAQQARLKSLGQETGAASVRSKQLDLAIRDVADWRGEIKALVRRAPQLDEWPKVAGPEDLLAQARTELKRVSGTLSDRVRDLDLLLKQLEQLRTTTQATGLKLEEEARGLRREVEQFRTGAGTAAQKVSALQEQALQLEAIKGRATELEKRLSGLRGERSHLLSALQELRDIRFSGRSKIARTLTHELGPRIQVAVEQGGYSPAYVSTIQGAIRGSGLHHTTLAPQLASAMSPRELSEAAERGDAGMIANLTGISADRAAKVVAAIARAGTEDIVTATIHDAVTMSLLDGTEYKPTTSLSMGQRCTVVLSVLLGYQGRGLIIDQPEDHLDNAFIVDTLIEAVRRQKNATQLILTTHNANIPVLGEADQVILMGSDGQRGFVRHRGPLNDPQVVQSITTVMEGGREAFERRATFYRSRLDK